MKKRIGSKIYDTDTAILVDTTAEGIQIYRKSGRSSEVFIYNPKGRDKYEMFFTLPEDEAAKYLPQIQTGTKVFGSGKTIRFSPDDRNRIKRLASEKGMSMAQFLLQLVDEYEARH